MITTLNLSSVNAEYLNAVTNLTLEEYRPLLTGSIHVLDLLSQANKEMCILYELAKPLSIDNTCIEIEFLQKIIDQQSEMGSVIVSIGEAAGYLVTESLIKKNY